MVHVHVRMCFVRVRNPAEVRESSAATLKTTTGIALLADSSIENIKPVEPPWTWDPQHGISS